MSYRTVEPLLPRFMVRPLFGDRATFGLEIREDDPCWQEWQKVHELVYFSTQKKSVGTIVNNAGYRVMNRLNLDNKHILEIGPGEIGHFRHWRGRPALVTLADCRQCLLDHSSKQLKDWGVSCETKLLDRHQVGALPFDDGQFDAVISFYSLEHLYPLRPALAELTRVLRPGGHLVGAIPAEGGLAWGIGRFLTSRRWCRRNINVNFDKIICWEHPSFAGQILRELDSQLQRQHVDFWPLKVPLIDINLVVRFLYQKAAVAQPDASQGRDLHVAA